MRASDFKRAWRLAAGALFTLTLLILAACGEDEPQADPVTVQFTTAAQTIAEDGGAKNITLSLSGAATKDGTISLTTAPANANTFATFPGEIVITKGSTSAQFTLTPINNAVIDDAAKVITFTLGTPSSGFKLGAQTTHAVTITDDEGPTTANFAVSSGEVLEGSATGIDVVISLSSAADVAGTIEITYAPSADAFTSEPAVAANKITVQVAAGATQASFKVIPVDNEETGDAVVTFTIANTTGGVAKGTNLTYELTITDNDGVELKTIAEIRALFTGSEATITQNYKIRGIITSSNDNVTSRNAYIQDETAAIQLRFVNNNTLQRGDDVEVLLKDVLIGLNSGLMQLGGSGGLANAKATKIADGALPAYKVITIEELNSGDYESQLVQLNNVSFVGANGVATLNGNKTLTDGTNTTIVRTENYAPWKDNPAPVGTGTLKGIAGIFTPNIQVTPQVAADIFANNPTGVIGITGTLADFGSVNNGEESAEQMYTIEGTTLSGDINISASTGFKISFTAGGTYESSLVIPAANANSATDVYVKFMPTTGADQEIEGTITHTAAVAVPVILNVTGTETGNGAAAHETLALWTFETSKPDFTGATISNLQAEEGLQAGTAVAGGVHASAATVYSNPAGNGSAESFSSNTWAPGDYYEFSLNSTGFSDIKISWDQMGSNTGPGSFVLQYSTDGTNFTQFGDPYSVINVTWSSGAPVTTTSHSFDLSSVTSLNNAATLVFRLVVAPGSLAINGSAIAAGGTGRVDNVKIEGR